MNDVVRAILNTLLDRYEQPDRQNTVRVRLLARDQPLYFASDDPAPRQETNAALEQLARAGALRLRWRKWEEGNWLEAVDFIEQDVATLYRLLERVPRASQDQVLRQLLDDQQPRAEWHASFVAWARAQLDAHRSVAPLSRDDPQLNHDLLRALGALAELHTPTLERSLSVRLFGDSKRLETLRGAIVRVLRQHDRTAGTFGEDDRALLQAHQLDRAPEYVPIAGPLALRLAAADGREPAVVDLIPLQPSVALSAAMLRSAEVTVCYATDLITVENATSFHELLAARPPRVLAIYTGGFASPTVIRLLQAIRAARPDLPVWHWGDLDAGGLRILAHLRAHLDAVQPLAMSPALFEAYRAFAQPLTIADCASLAVLRESAALADCVPLIDTLLAAGQKLEQEAIDVGVVLDQIAWAA
jgi:hypothetical protein